MTNLETMVEVTEEEDDDDESSFHSTKLGDNDDDIETAGLTASGRYGGPPTDLTLSFGSAGSSSLQTDRRERAALRILDQVERQQRESQRRKLAAMRGSKTSGSSSTHPRRSQSLRASGRSEASSLQDPETSPTRSRLEYYDLVSSASMTPEERNVRLERPLEGPRRYSSNRMEKKDMYFTFPADTYTSLYMASPSSLLFWFAVTVYVIQLLLLLLLFYQQHQKSRSTQGGTWAGSVETTPELAAAQVLVLAVACLGWSQVGSLLGVACVGYPPHVKLQFPHATVHKWTLSLLLRFLQATFGLVVTLVVGVLPATSLVDLLQRVVPVALVCLLHVLAGAAMQQGALGTRARRQFHRMTQVLVPEPHHTQTLCLHAVVFLTLVAAWAVVYSRQRQGSFLASTTCRMLHVQLDAQVILTFDESTTPPLEETLLLSSQQNNNDDDTTLFGLDPGFGELPFPPPLLYEGFSGTYHAVASQLHAHRPVYRQEGLVLDNKAGMLYYCRPLASWVFTIPALPVPPETVTRACPMGWLARSPRTEARSLEELASEPWQYWNGRTLQTATLEATCLACRHDADCGLNRGVCQVPPHDTGSNTPICACHDGAVGNFCESDAPTCPYWIKQWGPDKQEPVSGNIYTSHAVSNHTQTSMIREFGPYHLVEGVQAYGRNVYQSSSLKEDSESVQVLLYTGRRWSNLVMPKNGLDLFVNDETLVLHTYWGLMASTLWYSEPTDSYTPDDGFRQWYSLQSDYDNAMALRIGRLDHSATNVDGSFECLAMDCSLVGICGSHGTCTDDQTLTVAGQAVQDGNGTLLLGGQCVCDDVRTGRHCEIAVVQEELPDGEL